MPSRSSTAVIASALAAVVLILASHPVTTVAARADQKPAVPKAVAEDTASIELPMEVLVGRPLIRGTVNGSGSNAMLIDPQLQTSVVTPALADRLKLKRARTAAGQSRSAVDLVFGAHTLANVVVDVVDLGLVIPELSAEVQPAVVLSLSVWADQLVTLDFARWRLSIVRAELPEPNGRDVFGLDPTSKRLRVPIQIGGVEMAGQLDMWFPNSILLPSIDMTRLPLVGKPIEGPAVHTRERSLRVREAQLAEELTIAGVAVRSPLAMFGDVDSAIVGSGALTRIAMTYDVTRNRARISESGK